MNCTWKGFFWRLPTVDRSIFADIYNEFLFRLSPETSYFNCMPVGFGFHQDRIMGFKRGNLGALVGMCEFHLNYF